MITSLATRLWSQPIFLLAATALMWGGNTVAGRLAVGHISPFALTFLRWSIVILVLWPLYGHELKARWTDVRPKLPRITAMAALGFTGFNALYYVAAHHTSAINMGILQGTVPIFVLMLAFLMQGTRASLLQILGVLVTMVGVVVVATQGEPTRLMALAFNQGDIALIVACLLYAFYTVGLRDRPSLTGPGFFTLLTLIAALTSVPLLAYEVVTGAFFWPTTQGWLVALWVAIFPSCLSQLFFMRGVDLIGPSRAGVFVNLVPIFAAILAVSLINEPFGLFHAVALVLVLGGIWLTQLKRRAG
jgi:drug/metabolite transporter (DMT)-like permease